MKWKRTSVRGYRVHEIACMKRLHYHADGINASENLDYAKNTITNKQGSAAILRHGNQQEQQTNTGGKNAP